jgi:hypothetical protein
MFTALAYVKIRSGVYATCVTTALYITKSELCPSCTTGCMFCIKAPLDSPAWGDGT